MTQSRIQQNRKYNAGERPSTGAVGELYVNMADNQLGVMESGNTPKDLLGVPFFSATSVYKIGDHVIYGGKIRRAEKPTGPGAFDISCWGYPDSSYVLPPATASTLGGVKATVGTGFVTGIDIGGNLTYGNVTFPPPYTLPVATPTVIGGVKANAGSGYVTGIASDGSLTYGAAPAPYVLPAPTATTLGGVLAKAPVAGNYVSGIGLDGAPITQPFVVKDADFINVKNHGAVGDGVHDDAVAIQSAIDLAATNGGIVFFPGGTYLIKTALDLKRKYIGLQGVSQIKSVIKAGAAMESVIDIMETAATAPNGYHPKAETPSATAITTAQDVMKSPFTIEKLGVDGGDLAVNGINVNARHGFAIRDVDIINCTHGLHENNTWLGYHENISIRDFKGVGLFLGSALYGDTQNTHSTGVHCSTYNRVTIGSSGSIGIFHGSLSVATAFNNCDVEYLFGPKTAYTLPTMPSGAALKPCGVYIENGQPSFNDCYIGEGNTVGPAFYVLDGQVNVNGGYLVCGEPATSLHLFETVWGVAFVEGASIWADRPTSGVEYLVKRSVPFRAAGGTVAFTHCRFNASVAGDHALFGDCLGREPRGQVFAPRFGSSYTPSAVGAVISTTTHDNDQQMTVTTPGGSTAIVGMVASLIAPKEMLINRAMMLIVVYRSTCPVNVRLSSGFNGANGAVFLPIGVLPDTAGAVKTYVRMDVDYTGNPALTTLDFYINPPLAVDNMLHLYEVYLTDSSFSGAKQPNGGDFHNLYKS